MAQENKARSGHFAAYSTSPFPAHGSGACVTTMVRWCDQVRVRHVRWPRCGRDDLREKGDDPDLHLGVAHNHSVGEMQERLAEMDCSEKEQSAETARRRHWNPNCSRKWRPSRMCTRAGCDGHGIFVAFEEGCADIVTRSYAAGKVVAVVCNDISGKR